MEEDKKEKVWLFIVNNKLEEAIEELLRLTQENGQGNLHKEVASVGGYLENVESDNNSGMLSFMEYGIGRSKAAGSLLDLLEEYDSDYQGG